MPKYLDAETMIEQSLKTLTATCGGKLGLCTRKMNETRTLFDAQARIEMIDESVAALRTAMNELSEAHLSVQALLSDEDKEKDRTDWYAPKVAVFESFLHEVNIWKKFKSDP